MVATRFENLDGNVQAQRESFAFQSEAGRFSPSERRQAFGDMALPTNKAAQDALPDGAALLASIDAGQKITQTPKETRTESTSGIITTETSGKNGQRTETDFPNGRFIDRTTSPDGTVTKAKEESPNGSVTKTLDSPRLNQTETTDFRGNVESTTTLKDTGREIKQETPVTPKGFETDDHLDPNIGPSESLRTELETPPPTPSAPEAPEAPVTAVSSVTSDSTVASNDTTNTQPTTAT